MALKKTIALTGASGFVGSHLLPRLLDAGVNVRALRRRGSGVGPENLHWVAGKLEDRGALAELVAGADAVIHVAARIKAIARADFFATNEKGTIRLAEAARDAGANRFLFLSSYAARHPQLSAYAASKRAAEIALSHGFGAGLDWTILRAPAVYGPGDRETLKIFRSLRWGLAPRPGGNGRSALIHVDDLAQAIMAALAAPATIHRVLDVDDGQVEGYRLDDIYRMIALALNRQALTITLPFPVLYLAGAINKTLSRAFGIAPMLTTGKARELCYPDWSTGDERLADLIDWRARIPARKGLADVLAWYRSQRWL